MLKRIVLLPLLGLIMTAQTGPAAAQYMPAPAQPYQYAPQVYYNQPQAMPNYEAGGYYAQPAYVEQPTAYPQMQAQPDRPKTPASVIVCRSKQCAPAKLSMSKEYIYNTLLHMFDSNARQKALVCAADSHTHACTEEYLYLPINVGITPAYMYIDDVKISDVSISDKNTAALNLMLNWGISYNGQTPTCRPSKTLLYVKDVNNIIIEDNGYNCKMTTIGTTNIKTMFAVDYIDLDYGYIGGFYSIGLSGPANGGGSGYMLLRLPNDISMNPKDFIVPTQENNNSDNGQNAGSVSNAINGGNGDGFMVQGSPDTELSGTSVPNVDTVIRYNHASQDYDRHQAQQAREKATMMRYNGVQVFPISTSAASANKADNLKDAVEQTLEKATEE